jgi:aspartyl-tRNA(Asn)/glutamyl-tRNA(Gln) amidotransferase subunit A
VPRSYFLDVLDNDVRTQFEDVIRRLRTAGATIDDVWIPHAADTPAVYLHIQAPEAAAYHAPAIERHPEAYSPAVRLRLEAGRYLLAEDYVRAQRGREVLRREVDAALEGHAALVLPTVAIPPPPIGAAEVEVSGCKEAVRGLMLRLTQLFNLTGHPVISIPSGTHAQGFPSGVQVIGPSGGTERLLELARACEQQLR